MISEMEEYKNLVTHRLDENLKSFNLLYGMKHYGNCISIMCQELDQIIRVLYLRNSSKIEQQQLMYCTITNHKWFIVNRENKKEYITDEVLLRFTKTLTGWDQNIYEFGFSFKNLTNNYNYGSRDPIKSMSAADRAKLEKYISEYHVHDFKKDFTLDDLIPVLPMIIDEISAKLKSYIEKI